MEFTQKLTNFVCKYKKYRSRMIDNYWNEKWKRIVFDENISEKEIFKISNYGRVLNCKGENEYLINKTYINGYQNLQVRQKKNGKLTSRLVHRLVAEAFLEQNDGLFVIHLNYDKTDNRLVNLKWATKKEKEVHQFNNPLYKNASKRRTYSKLTVSQVKLIKRKINNPNRRTRLKMIAKQFGISEMQLYRIKSGENWSSVTEF